MPSPVPRYVSRRSASDGSAGLGSERQTCDAVPLGHAGRGLRVTLSARWARHVLEEDVGLEE